LTSSSHSSGYGLVVAAERQQLVERQHLRVAICRETLKIEHDYLAELRAALAHIEVLIELFFVLDEKEARTAVVENVLDLSGGIGRIDAVGDAANAYDTHVGIEPFRLGLGENGNNFAAP